MRLAASMLCGIAAVVATAIPIAWLGKGLQGCHGLATHGALALGILTAAASWRITPPSAGRSPRSFWDWLLIVLFSCASARAFFWLIYADGDSWKILSPNNLGDLALHLSFINWLAVTPHWWPASPILTGDPLRYPPGCDLFNAVLLVSGIPLVPGLLWCALIGSALAGYTLWRWGGTVALAAFLFNGGLSGTLLLKTGWGGDPDAAVEWKNLFLTLFVTQRAFLYALPAGLLLLSAWRAETFASQRRIVLPLPVQALLLGVMPLFSIHSALFLGAAMTGVALLAPRSRGRMARLASLSWPPMAFFAWLVTSGAGGPSALGAVGWHLGWTSDGSVRFWFWNFGIALPLGVFLCLRILVPPGNDAEAAAFAEARSFVWPAAGVFLLCMLFRFAPWPWDNMKLMLWSWLTIIPFLWSLCLEKRSLLVRIPLLILLFGSGAVTLAAGLDGRHGYELIKRSTLEGTASLLKEVPPSEVLACAPEYNHPVLMLGHPVVCGYEGHLWSHGLDYRERWDLLQGVMRGDPGWADKARKLGVSHIYWSDLEAKRWPDSKLPWAKETVPALHRVE